MSIEIQYEGTAAIVANDRSAFTYEERSLPKGLTSPIKNNTPYFIGDYIVHPYGYNNDLPEEIRDVVKSNYLAPGILTKKTQLLWGVGPKLYQEDIVDNKIVRQLEKDKEIQSWLDSFDYEDYLLRCCVDFNHIEGVYTKFFQSKGGRVGKRFIAKLEHVDNRHARLATSMSSKTTKADRVIETDFKFKNWEKAFDYKDYPLFSFNEPFKDKVSVFYSNMYSFCTDYYSMPDLYGSLEWLRRSTNVPLIFKALSNNSLNVKYHVVSPQEFWDNKEDELKEKCTKLGQLYNDNLLKMYKENLLREISEVLSGDEAVGKFWHTTKSFTVEGTNLIEHGWEIKPIDQNMKELVESQIKISERADYAVAGGMNVHGALGNISGKGTSDSGSEQLYALKNYMLTGIDIPEMIVTKAINYAIKANWPNKNLKIGFVHNMPEKEQDISPSKRITNNV